MKHIKGSLVACALVLSGVAFIASPVGHSVAAPGTAVSTAGAGAFGQLGDGMNTALSTSHTAIAPATLANKTIQTISAGEYHVCAMTAEASRNVYCWGKNNYGQLGDDSSSDRNAPVQVFSNTGLLATGAAIAIAVGLYHSCVLVPQVAGLRAGYNEVMCWGYGPQLGVGASAADTDRPIVMNPQPAYGATDIDVYDTTTCVTLTNNDINCWGRNNAGQVGDGTTNDPRSIATAVDRSGVLSGKTPIDIQVGSQMTCVLTNEAANNLYCWGAFGLSGMSLGNGVTTGSTTPVAISLGGAKLNKLDIGGGHACGITSNNRLLCWGGNGDNHLGISGAPAIVTTPTAIDVSGAMGTLSLAGVTTGTASTCVWSTTGRLVCFGYTKGHFGVNPSTITGAVDLGGGLYVLRTPTAITGGSLAANGVRDFAMGDFKTSGAIVSALTSDESTANAGASTSSSSTTSSSTTSTTLANGSTTSSTVAAGTSTTATASIASVRVVAAKLLVARGTRRLSISTSEKVKVYQISYGRKQSTVKPRSFRAAVVRRTITIVPKGTVWVRVQSGSSWSDWVKAK